MRLAVFASGSGTNFEAIVKSCLKGEISCQVEILICDKKDAYVLTRAKNLKIRTFVFDPHSYKKRSDYEKEIVKILRDLKIDLICLAGYMRIVGNTLLDAYKDRIINIHPALLPSLREPMELKMPLAMVLRCLGLRFIM